MDDFNLNELKASSIYPLEGSYPRPSLTRPPATANFNLLLQLLHVAVLS